MYQDIKDEVVQLYLDDIITNRFQPREIFDEKALKELAVSIKEHGVIQPIIVRNVNGKYEIIAGERRYKASALAGMTKIPAIIRDLDDKESSKVALLENLQRKNLNPIEEARTYQKIIELDEMTQQDLAKTMGKSQSAVANKIRLLTLPDEIQDALLKEQILERHARTLLNIPDAKNQKEMLKKVIENKMSVRLLEEEIKNIYNNEESDDMNNNYIPLPPKDISELSNAYVNDNPLIPTADLPEDKSNYGKVTIAPPVGEEAPINKFINYGEIEEDEDEDDGNSFDIPPAISTVDINSIKNNSEDINTSAIGGDLDSLLNINGSINNKMSDNFITPAEKIVKTDPLENNQEDYFKTPDLSSINIPEISNFNESINTYTKENYSIEEATEKIRNLVEDLEQHGITVNTDEMNFEKSYQIIIKLDKDNN